MLASRWARRPFIRLTLTLDRGELAILIRDFCPGAPQPRSAGVHDENGRGLFLVQAIRLWREATRVAARRLYLYSILYLFALFAAMAVDRVISS